VLGRLADTALPYLHTLARGQNHIDQGDFTELFKDLPWFIAESALTAAGGQRLPQHVGQKTNQDVCAHAMLSVVPYRPDLQVRLVHAKGGFGFGELHVGAPQLLRRPVDHVAAQPVAAFTPPRPLPPTLYLRPPQLREVLGMHPYAHIEQPRRTCVSFQEPSYAALHGARFLPTFATTCGDLH